MATKKFMSYDRLTEYDALIKAEIDEKINANKIAVDSALSSTSTNPVQNKVIDAEFEAVSTAMNVLEQTIDGITTSKVNVSDIIDNLTTNVTNKPLSAAQGVAIKTLIDEIKEVKADWSQNDSASIDYIKNRPFWTGNPVETPLVDSVTFNTTARDGYAYAKNPFLLELIEGVEYDVTWNGTTYISTCRLLSGAPAIGNASILGMGDDTQEPFLINYMGSNYVYALSAESVVVSIVGHIPEIHKIDNKYIDFPEGSYIGVTNENFGEVFNDYENNTASGGFSHAEGSSTTASGNFSHAEGAHTIASGHWSHAEGYHTDATARWSHAEGYATTAASDAQHVQGKFNIVDTENKYAHIVGNGSSNSNLVNIHTLDWNGNANFAGDVYVGNANENKSGKKLATEEYVDSIELITVDDIDAICGASIQYASLNEGAF